MTRRVEPATTRISACDADLVLHPTIGLADHQALLQELIDDTPWQQQDITVFGKTWPQPRLVAWYGDPEASYSYSGLVQQPLPWTDRLNELRERVEQLAGHSFNSVLLNYYRDGSDSMGMHADDEPELGPEPVIASLSLGQPRPLRFRHRHRRDIKSFSLPLPPASLLIMAGATQRNWKHGINKTKRSCGPRVNLTFRRIYHDGDIDRNASRITISR
jgi:alkylated DNA repair dioxygenase AlkB